MNFEMPSCGGCRTCEMMCSFHHREVFAPELSSIRIIDREGSPGFRVQIMELNGGQRIACDGCRGTAVPLCLQYCKSSDDLEKILAVFAGDVSVPAGGDESHR